MPTKQTASKQAGPKPSRPHAPGYGLPKTSKGLLPWKWAEDRLTKSREYWIATMCPDRAPHVMVVWGLWWENEFCFSSGSQSRKVRNLDGNSKCVICNENADEAVIVEGVAERMRDVPRIREYLSIYQRKYKFDMAGMADGMISLKEPVFVVKPKKVFGLTEKAFATTATRWKFAE
jgi:Pyridoxamine 5'-phosphate oxidase